jgi:hypothetical protein
MGKLEEAPFSAQLLTGSTIFNLTGFNLTGARAGCVWFQGLASLRDHSIKTNLPPLHFFLSKP